ncbi:TonB-dependent receptor [Pseudomonas cavernae]|uniref:TonB-dependent receptor n=1 Tax=Pseudomonas cavernae TaxID=2320867 RepID=A0A385Z1N5_9PSED|nr:TonB-dependent receptor [Pseudomonas cavernae]AYC32047.1 TonB-dependent receptor [Pseudomonas cavernae]
MDRKYVLTSLGYAAIGLMLGIYMAASKNHGQLVTHAHIMLLGFVVSFVYALIHKLWLDGEATKIARFQYLAHQIGTLALVVGLFLFYGGFVAVDKLDPILGLASILVLIGMILMKIMYIKASKIVS